MKTTVIAALIVTLSVTSGAGAALIVTSKNIKNRDDSVGGHQRSR